MKVAGFTGLLMLILLSSSAFGQDLTTDSIVDTPVSKCSQERFEQAGQVFRDLRNRDSRESKLKGMLEECPDAAWYDQVSEFLKSVREENAQRSFEIAIYYQNLYNEGKSKSPEGAKSRYKMIVEKYPEFSKMDGVLLSLGDIQTAQGEFDDAWLTYSRLINEFPTSDLVTSSFQRLQRLQEIRLRQTAYIDNASKMESVPRN